MPRLDLLAAENNVPSHSLCGACQRQALQMLGLPTGPALAFMSRHCICS